MNGHDTGKERESVRVSGRQPDTPEEGGKSEEKTLKIFKGCNLSRDNSGMFTEEEYAAVRDEMALIGLASLQAF